LTSRLPRGVRDTICYKIVFEVTDDEGRVIAVQFVIRDPAELEAEAAGRTFD
jgi:hypothetical protein